MRNSVSLLLIIFLFSCNSPQRHNLSKDDSSNVKLEPKQNPSRFHDSVDKIQLLGTWTDGTTENATFDIQKDSIFYVNQLQSYPYRLKGDSLTIHYSDMIFKGKVYFIMDTMVLSDREFGTTKYTRFKN